MGNEKARRIVSIVLILFLTFVVYQRNHNASTSGKIKNIDRTGTVVFTDSRTNSDDYPFVSEVKIVSETSKELVFDVKYFKSQTVSGLYNLSLHPSLEGRVSDWHYNSEILKSGMNVMRITILYKPVHIARVKSETSALSLYIMRDYVPDNVDDLEENSDYVGKVFDRTIDFPKIWMK